MAGDVSGAESGVNAPVLFAHPATSGYDRSLFVPEPNREFELPSGA
jgi:hypothetical protein